MALSNLIFVIPGVLALAACGGPGSAAATGVVDDAISGGYLDPNDVSVVGVLQQANGGTALCSGSLIAPNLVLTARHCTSPILGESGGGVVCGKTGFGPLLSPRDFHVTTRPDFPQNMALYHAVSEVLGLPTADDLCGNDQSLLILADLVDPTEAAPLVPRVDSPLADGETYDAVGFGATNGTGTGVGTRRRRDGLTNTCVGDDCGDSNVASTEWLGDTGVCQGDSGGPALDLLKRVTGVASRGGTGCTTPIYGHVFGWADWIKSTALHAAAVGEYPAPSWATGWPTDPAFSAPIGAPCARLEDCAFDRCVSDPAAAYCSRLCNDQAPCPNGYQCDQAQTGLCLKLPPPPDMLPEPAAPVLAAAGCHVAGRAPAGARAVALPLALLAGLVRARSRRRA